MISYRSNSVRGHSDIIIDEANLLPEKSLIELFKMCNVHMITLSPQRFIEHLMFKYGYEKKENPRYREIMKNHGFPI